MTGQYDDIRRIQTLKDQKRLEVNFLFLNENLFSSKTILPAQKLIWREIFNFKRRLIPGLYYRVGTNSNFIFNSFRYSLSNVMSFIVISIVPSANDGRVRHVPFQRQDIRFGGLARSGFFWRVSRLPNWLQFLSNIIEFGI